MLKRFTLFAFLAMLLSGCSLPFISGKNQGALQVTSNLAAAVFLDDSHAGQTPFFDENLKVGEYTLKLVPSGDNEEGAWQTKISVSKRVLSVVNYDFGSGTEEASYEVLELEPLSNDKATELTISTLPDNVIVKLDGELKGFSPISFDDISEGDHTINLEAPGYKEKTINAKVNLGHRLNVIVQLAKDLSIEEDRESTSSAVTDDSKVEEDQEKKADGEKTPSASPTPSPVASPLPTPTPSTSAGVVSGVADASGLTAPYVKILEASPEIDWLRVHSEPKGGLANEVAKVKVGTFFKFVEDNGSGWYKIEYQTGDEGWIAGRYSELTE